jgi:hypothetical protein
MPVRSFGTVVSPVTGSKAARRSGMGSGSRAARRFRSGRSAARWGDGKSSVPRGVLSLQIAVEDAPVLVEERHRPLQREALEAARSSAGRCCGPGGSRRRRGAVRTPPTPASRCRRRRPAPRTGGAPRGPVGPDASPGRSATPRPPSISSHGVRLRPRGGRRSSRSTGLSSTSPSATARRKRFDSEFR